MVPFQSLISIKLSLKWALDEVSTINLTFPCVMEVLTILTIFHCRKLSYTFLFFDKIQNFKKILSRYPKIHPKQLLNHNFSKIAFYSPLLILILLMIRAVRTENFTVWEPFGAVPDRRSMVFVSPWYCCIYPNTNAV